jgi:cytochrome c5
MKNYMQIFAGALLLATLPALSQTANGSAPAPAGQKQVKHAAVHATAQDDGQRVFEQNCSRCHTTPQGFSPRISGTVARHMRVRAGLSQKDEQALLRFLNP